MHVSCVYQVEHIKEWIVSGVIYKGINGGWVTIPRQKDQNTVVNVALNFITFDNEVQTSCGEMGGV